MNHLSVDCLLHCLFKRRSKKTSMLRVTGLCGNSPMTGEFPAQMANNTGNVSIWWRHCEDVGLIEGKACSLTTHSILMMCSRVSCLSADCCSTSRRRKLVNCFFSKSRWWKRPERPPLKVSHYNKISQWQTFRFMEYAKKQQNTVTWTHKISCSKTKMIHTNLCITLRNYDTMMTSLREWLDKGRW